MKLISSLETKDYENSVIARDVYSNGRLVLRKDTVIEKPTIKYLMSLDSDLSLFIRDDNNTKVKDILGKEILNKLYSKTEDLFNNYAVHDDNFKRNREETLKSINYIIKDVLKEEVCLAYLEEVFTRNRRIFKNTLAVTVLSLYLGVRGGFSRKALHDLGIGAIIHNLGKVRLYSEYPTLGDDSHLYSFHEYELMKTHPIIAYRELEKVKSIPVESKKIVLFHNVWEDYDASYSEYRKTNTSYPRIYEGKTITREMKDNCIGIVQVSALFHALISKTVNMNVGFECMSKLDAFKYIEKVSGTMLNPGVVKLFVNSISPFSIGESVRLSDGRRAVVEKHTDDIYNPIIECDGKIEDLRKNKEVSVVKSMIS